MYQFISHVVHYLMALDAGDHIDLVAIVNGMVAELRPHVGQLHASLGGDQHN